MTFALTLAMHAACTGTEGALCYREMLSVVCSSQAQVCPGAGESRVWPSGMPETVLSEVRGRES